MYYEIKSNKKLFHEYEFYLKFENIEVTKDSYNIG